MPSELTEISQNTNLSNPTQKDESSPIQHGILQRHPPALSGSRERVRDGAPVDLDEADDDDDDADTHASSCGLDDRPNEIHEELKIDGTRDRLGVDLQGDLVASAADDGHDQVRKARGSSTRHDNQAGRSLMNLPSELLIHSLSHLAPSDLASTALVCRELYDVVTTPDAWRAAFARYFPGPTVLKRTASSILNDDAKKENFRSDRRAFCRLGDHASWRSEYIIRTRLLRSLARGRPALDITPASGSSPRGSSSQSHSPVVMFNSRLFTTINQLHATFNSGPSMRQPRVIHGSDYVGAATYSDPATGKVDAWGLSDPQEFFQFADRFVGDAMWGLGPGEVVGNENVMDVSQLYGMVHGEGFPGGMVYYRPVEEKRGRFLLNPIGVPEHELGIPRIPTARETISSIWIAKSPTIPSLTEGRIGILSASSLGIVSAYSLGHPGLRNRNMSRGELTARWALSPGVPIVAISVDENYSPQRQAQNRIWAVVLNALGEVFHLTKFPTQPKIEVALGQRLSDEQLESLAWVSGRTIRWNLVEPSRRIARMNPFDVASVDGSYSPHPSWDGMCMSPAQVRAETAEIERFLHLRPKDFRAKCIGWDMQRKMEVDFAGDDGNYAGEGVVVLRCGLDIDTDAEVKRFIRCRMKGATASKGVDSAMTTPRAPNTPTEELESIFGHSSEQKKDDSKDEDKQFSEVPSSDIYSSRNASPERGPTLEEWRCSEFSFGTVKDIQFTTVTLDCSTHAKTTLSEDTLLATGGDSPASSPTSSPVDGPKPSSSAAATMIPGQRARFLAAGTKTGSIFIWDVRSAFPQVVTSTQAIQPIRIIYTDSPEISCLALTALYLVHGGNDGLVQAWDPLASTTDPVRTLNSRFSARARRRLAQAQASPQGVGINFFAAEAVILDPNPKVLRGVVAVGTHLKYWSYRAGDVDGIGGKISKRKLRRRSERGSNNQTGSVGMMRNVDLKGYIEDERKELEAELKREFREKQRLKHRFGMGWLGEEEELKYAMVLSEESFSVESHSQSREATPKIGSGQEKKPTASTFSNDHDLAEAIRRSLEGVDTNSAGSFSSPSDSVPASPSLAEWNAAVKVAQGGKDSPKSGGKSPGSAAGPSNTQELDDIELALALSMIDQTERAGTAGDEFPALGNSGSGGSSGRVSGKGKLRAE